MIDSTLSTSANDSAHNDIITPSTTIVIELSTVSAMILSIINTGIHRCRAVVTTITSTVVVLSTTLTMIAINTITLIITSTRMLSLLFLTVLFKYLCEDLSDYYYHYYFHHVLYLC